MFGQGGTLVGDGCQGRQRSVPRNLLWSVAVTICLGLSVSGSAADGGDVTWVKRAGSNSVDEGSAVAVDATGKIYTTGYFKSTATFGPGEENQTVLTAVSQDVFAAKHNADGTLSWVRQAKGFGWGTGIAVDIAMNVYVVGYFGPTITFNAGQPDELVLNALANDVFVAKYDGAGHFLWAKQAGGSLSEYGQAIAVDGTGSCYITGRYGSNPATFGAGEANETKLAGVGGNNGEDIFVAKFNTDGVLQWARSAGGATGNRGSGIGVDAAGNSYVVGRYSGTSTFGSGEPNQTTLTAPLGGSDEIFIAKFGPDGRLHWVRSGQGEAAHDQGNAIAVDADGNSFATGTYNERAPFGGILNQTQLDSGGSDDIFVVKHDKEGNLKWVKMAVGNGSQFSLGIALDENANSYITGYGSSLTFGAEEPGEVSLGGFGLADVFVAKYDANGLLQWARLAGGGSDDRGQGIAAGAGGVCVIGRFGQTATFGSGEANQTAIVSAGSSDIFIAKFHSGAEATDAPSFIGFTLLPNGNPQLTISGAPATSYVIERASALINPQWNPVRTLVTDAQGQVVFEDTDETLEFPAFYRFVVK